MKKHILSTTGLVVAFGLVASPVFAAHAPKAAHVTHHVTKTESRHVTKTVQTVELSHGKRAAIAPAPAPKGKVVQKAKPIIIPKLHEKEAQKFLSPVVKNIAKVTNNVQILTKFASAFNSSNVPTELAFYQYTLERLTGLSNQLNALTKQVDQIARKYGQTADVTDVYALINAAKTSVTNEIDALKVSITNVTATTTGSNAGSTVGTTDGTTTGSTIGTTDGTTTGSTTGTTDGTTAASTDGTFVGSASDTTSGTTALNGSTTDTVPTAQ